MNHKCDYCKKIFKTKIFSMNQCQLQPFYTSKKTFFLMGTHLIPSLHAFCIVASEKISSLHQSYGSINIIARITTISLFHFLSCIKIRKNKQICKASLQKIRCTRLAPCLSRRYCCRKKKTYQTISLTSIGSNGQLKHIILESNYLSNIEVFCVMT